MNRKANPQKVPVNRELLVAYLYSERQWSRKARLDPLSATGLRVRVFSITALPRTLVEFWREVINENTLSDLDKHVHNLKQEARETYAKAG